MIKACVPNLKTNIKYIQNYRHKSLISSEDDYFLCLLEQGVSHIENNLSSLKIENDQLSINQADENEIKRSNISFISIFKS